MRHREPGGRQVGNCSKFRVQLARRFNGVEGLRNVSENGNDHES